MEDWIPLTSYDSLDSWTSTNLFFAPNISVVRTTDSHGGTYAAKMNGTTYLAILPVPGGIGTNAKVIISPLSITGGYPYEERPNAFTGWFKYTPANNDSCIILALLTKWNGIKRDTIGIASFIGKGNTPTYTSFYSPFLYFSPEDPDTAFVLALTSANFLAAQTGSVMYVDDLDFAFNTGVDEVTGESEL